MHHSRFSYDSGRYIFSVATTVFTTVSYLLAFAWHCRHITQIHKTVGIEPHVGHETAIRTSKELALEKSPCHSSNVRSHYLVQKVKLDN